MRAGRRFSNIRLTAGFKSNRLRILLISHTCQSRAEGQRKAEQLSRLEDIKLKVVVPERFNHYGRWQRAEAPAQAGFDFQALKIMWPWLGPAQNYLHWYPGLANVIREFEPDVIDLWEEPWSLVSAQACWLRNRLRPAARIVMESEQNLHKNFPPPFRWIENYTIRNADFAVGRSSEVIRVLRAKNYCGPARVVGNAVDISVFKPLDRAACRQKLGLSGFVAGYAGRLVERKGLMDMVDALAFLPGEVRMVFAGSGGFQPRLAARARELGRAGQVHFLPARPLEELPEVMNAFDALVLPSWTVPTWKEQFGRVLIEAHACGTPVIGADSGAIPEVVGGGGLIFPERDPRALAGAIMELKENAPRRRELGMQGRRQVEENFTWEKIAVQMSEIYHAAERPRSAEVAIPVQA